jgi:post-segregation antitoxin (ccd killing protein)
VDITVYLPDEVAQRAKAQNVNLSRVLRDALTAQFAEEDAVRATLEEARTVVLELKTDEGRAYRGRMEATLIGEDATTGTAVYLRRSGEVITYRPEDHRFSTVEDPATELIAVLPTNEYIAAMDALGIVPEVDLDSGLVGVASRTGSVPSQRRTTGQKLRSVPGDLVEPPVSFLKRLAGHGDGPKEGEPTAEASASPAARAPDAPPETEAPPDPEASST